jgi:hypothetical protein
MMRKYNSRPIFFNATKVEAPAQLGYIIESVLSQIARWMNLRLFEGEPILAPLSFKRRHVQPGMILLPKRSVVSGVLPSFPGY